MRHRLILDDITHTYEDGGTQRTVLDHLSLHVSEGEFVAVMGLPDPGRARSCRSRARSWSLRAVRFCWTENR